jgi:K(+)-stimulated pyrophosphate-energized sodium pump
MKRHGAIVYGAVAIICLGLFIPQLQGKALFSQESTSGSVVGSTTTISQPQFKYFEFLSSVKYSTAERASLFAALFIALAGLLYAMMLVKQVRGADKGTAKMQQIAKAVRDGSDAYLKRQLKSVAILVGILVVALFCTKALSSDLGVHDPFAWGRAGAFLVGALFSATVGFVGMRMATTGNLRVAQAAKVGFGRALMLGYRSGTITGMLTDGLGLLGGTLIFMMYGEHAYEALLGFGFGGTLLALFMRVGGGIYTKAADVGADLVGKIEKDIPEDDPRNAATIADNVGDNVGDCAGMAADIFESYEVTIVAAMILGYIAFGHKGVIFPILVRSIGVLASIVSTYLVRASDKGTVASAMKSINFGFWMGSALSVIGFMTLGFMYLRFDAGMVANNSLSFQAWDNIQNLGYWANLGHVGMDLRPAWACLVGVLLCLALNRTTEYFTGTEYNPVKGMVRNCTTGHATNIIEGFSVGYESAVVTGLVLCGAIMTSVLVYSGTNPLCVAYGVAMCGIGMLTLTGNTISMDVFGPIADNANGIGEMGYEKEEMGEAKYAEARQILADLDAVGNTTKAVTKGVAIGSAVIASVSLFASFITVVGSGGGNENAALPTDLFAKVAGLLSISQPKLLVGMIIGGAIPMLFSSMTIRAVGRAAFLIVNECRVQFRRPGVMEGTTLPDYGLVVDICTGSAQHELIGPALLAVFAPILTGFLLGPIGLAGFLGGSIIVGQLLASFMCNSGGAWDNCKKMIEDEPRNAELNTGKGSEKHKAAVTGDTVGDPLKDTAGPAINPLLKVMNMVAVLTVPLMAVYDRQLVANVRQFATESGYALRAGFVYHSPDLFWVSAVVISAAILVWSVRRSHQESAVREPASAVDLGATSAYEPGD